jgi:dTMP kinase
VSPRTGKLLVLEGPEGAGKTTQAPLVAEWIGSFGGEVVCLREPGGTPVGDQVRRILLDSADGAVSDAAEALLYTASRAELVNRVILPALGRQAIVVLDRFFLSTYAYQIAGRGLPEAEVRAANRLALAGVVPDLTIMLIVSPDKGLDRVARRGARDRLERAEVEFHGRVARAYERYLDPDWQKAHPECGPLEAVDASDGVAEVFSRIKQVLQRRWPESFPSRPRQPA